MRERPILFSGPLVRAILEGRKTQTRRIVTPQPIECLGGSYWSHEPESKRAVLYDSERTLRKGLCEDFAPWRPSDRLWVRETWGGDDCCGVAYRADHPDWPCFRGDGEQPDGPWRPSIHMPRWASRITLEVISVRVERLQEISEDDARAEGVDTRCMHEPDESPEASVGWRNPDGFALDNFRELWDRINGKRAPWASNPWVWVIGFKTVEVRR